MIIDVIKVKHEGKNEAHFTFEYDAPNDLIISLPGAVFARPVTVEATISLDGKDVYADVTLSYQLKGDCSRCLESALASVSYSYSAKYSLFPQEDEYPYKSGKIDLTASVNESLIVSQPSVIYCKEDCKGLCPVCGANLNQVDCGHGKF
ncbi:MAG: DUF177 domain-containing protein [Clostridia bacterium]|nr:DUF177 domain-containing protein [Clostridia bacterium]